ncbi:hypothetical protein AVEN_90262-1 [Araneus ventricosus]|uniref:Mutator-like transposase domain-containing protein n=1 Tax=Araneus ventricosus TaxID=182803 RepID=A0A4Y2G4N6_ARAVE|nr:hypothetical protein AVEN_90262-1 [Araneus ventricosus]
MILTQRFLRISREQKSCHNFVKKCNTKPSSSFALKHECANHKGSSGNMEVIGAYRIFERSVNSRGLIYSEYFGDGDFKGYDDVKDIYDENSVAKCESIGHVRKRMGTHLRNLKNKNKKLGGKGKLTDNFINKLQNYYGIAIRANVFFYLKPTPVRPTRKGARPLADRWGNIKAIQK